MNWDFLKEDSKLSSSRVAFFGILALFIPTFVTLWAIVSIESDPIALADIPDSIQWLLGILLGAKIAHKIVEVAGDVLKKPKAENGQ